MARWYLLCFLCLAAALSGAGCDSSSPLQGSTLEGPEDDASMARDASQDVPPDDAGTSVDTGTPDGEANDGDIERGDGPGEGDGLTGDVEPELLEEDAEEGSHSDASMVDVPDTPEEPEEPEEPVVRSTDFRVLHWNIAGGKENNCATAGITRAVIRYVREAPGAIDFISLNEVCSAQYDSIRDALRDRWGKGGNDRFAAFQGSGGSRVGNAIFSRRNIYGVTRLEVGEDQYGKRYLLCGRQEGRRVRVCTTHLTPGDATARRQLARVLNKLEDWWANQRDTVVIGGDFNIQPNDQGFNAMYSAAANTSNNPNNRGRYRELDDDDPNHCRGYGERSQPTSSGGPCNQGRKIDLIFVRANRIEDGRYSADTLNIPNDCTGVCSDHRAVRGFARIKFRTD